jgi:hypothetical protein
LRVPGPVQKPDDTDDVYQSNPEAIMEPIFGNTPFTRSMVDRFRDDAEAGAHKKSGKKAVHVVKVGKTQENIPREELEAAPGIGGAVPKQPSAHGIGHL